MAVSQKVTLTQGVQSIENNTTEVTFTWTSTQSGESLNLNKRTAYYYVSINGGEEVEYSVSYTLPQSSTKTIVNKTFIVEHDDNGEGSISIRTYMDTRISAGVVKKSASLDLTTIPRASTFDSLSCNTSYFDGTLTYKYTPKSASFYNKIDVYIQTASNTFTGLKTIKIGEKTASQQTATLILSDDDLAIIYSKFPTVTKGTLRFTLRTYSDSGYTTQIGNMVSRDISLTIPISVKPSFESVSIDPDDITKTDNTIAVSTLIQGKNKIKISISGSKAGAGSSLKSYTFDVLSGSTIIATQTTTSASITIGPFSQTGDLKFRVTITDNRNRTINNSGNEPKCKCNEYKPPYFTAFNAYRANSDGSANINGTFLKCTYSPVYSSVNSTNSAIVTAYYNGSTKNGASGSVLINLNGDATTTYKVYLAINDKYGGTGKTSTITVLGQARIFNISSDGMGVAVGKMSEKTNENTNGLFECAFDAKFYKDITLVEPLSMKNGGLGATTATDALKNLGLTATATELNYVDGVTSSIQTQLDAKQEKITGGISNVVTQNFTSGRVIVSNTNGKASSSAITSTELGYLDGVTSNIQTQLDSKTQVVKLWENASPDSNFTDTTNAYGGSLANYTGVIIYFKNTSGDGSLYLSSGYIPKGQSGTLLYTTSAPKQAYRKFTVSDNGVIFQSGNLSGSTSNTYCIPIIIYGCKGVG